jgi:hypothetical protein
MKKEAFEKFFSLRILGDQGGLEPFPDDGKLKEILLADSGKDLQSSFCGLNRGEFFHPGLNTHSLASSLGRKIVYSKWNPESIK